MKYLYKTPSIHNLLKFYKSRKTKTLSIYKNLGINMFFIDNLLFHRRNSLIFLLYIIMVLIHFPSLAHSEVKKTETPALTTTIGGNFLLTNQNGKAVKNSDFLGRTMLVFFGFTHCPDVCPVTISTLSKTLSLLGDKSDRVVPIFISVDPKRDTPDVLRAYLQNFDSRIVALTGSPQDIKKAADAYKIYFSINTNSKNGAEDYQVDHSSIIYMMNTKGEYVRHFSYDTSAQDIANAVLEDFR